MAREGIVTITGPGLDLQTRDGVGAATSRALTAAQAHVRAQRERPVSFYVRDDQGEARARVDVEADGTTTVRRLDRGAGDANLEGEPARALRAASLPVSSEASPTRRSDPPTANQEEDMATQKTRTRSSGGAKRSSARKTTTSRKTTTARRSGEVAAAAMNRVSAKDATTAVLKAAEGPMSVAEIAEKVLATDGVRLAGKTPAATIAAILSVENKKADGLFVRVEKGKYALRETATA
jgi:hypothetical protein